MKILRSAGELRSEGRGVCLAIGFFDGVHLGHQQIIRQTIADARRHDAAAVVMTFDQHPNAIVAPSRVPPLIYSLRQKLRAIETLGPDAVLLMEFTPAFRERSGEQFVRGLVTDLGRLRSICVGADFVFGHHRSGNVELLRRLGEVLKFDVHGLAAVALDDKIVSSTRIRETIAAGMLPEAGEMLGRAYSLAGTVVHGDGLGRRLGFATANLDIRGLALPPTGVYTAHALAGCARYRSVVNIGRRPTLQHPTPALRVEAHLLDFAGDLYDLELELVIDGKLREETAFPSLAALRDQIHADVAQAKSRV